MATTINSTGLDFDSIRNNLKTWLEQKPEFADYNFEASGLSNILDVLAYNTHYNGLIANFALNESFLSTAQLRSSMIGLSTAIGYIPNSKVSSIAVINVTASGTATTSNSLKLPANTKFTTTVDDVAYTFQTTKDATAFKQGSGPYSYTWENVTVREGIEKQKTFIAGTTSEIDTYVIPNQDIDINTVEVTVGSTNKQFYNVSTVSELDQFSRIFIIKETPNGYFEVAFGNGASLGEVPVSGDKIVVTYNSCAGTAANGARTFTTTTSIPGGDGSNLSIIPVTITNSYAGANKESIESIRKAAPFLYAAQNRMVTADDYAALIRRNFSSQISDILCWGGEDNIPAQYGAVYVSITPSPTESLKADIRKLVKNLAVVAFDVVFIDPITTYVEVDLTFQYNQTLSSYATIPEIEAVVGNVVSSYLDTVTDEFSETFRRSNLLTLVDASDPGVLSSQAAVKIQQRFVPVLGISTAYTLAFPASITAPSVTSYAISSSEFIVRGTTCILRNRLGSNVLEILSVVTGKIIIDNVGNYDAALGTVNISGFTPSAFSGTSIKVTVVPANQGNISTLRENKLGKDPIAITTNAIETTTL
tara:strand:+ start:13255 stop:15027 length:1773 start_codon:yes stop_codon:yes gene_type:complete